MHRGSWAALLGFIVGILGVATWLSPAGPFLERTGLDWLFTVRGPVDAPQGVVIVSIDEMSARRLDLPPDPENWPRSLHADLIDQLVQRGAAVIVFDLWFENNGVGDAALKSAIQTAGRVVLFESMQSNGALKRPIQKFADAATGLAPWVVPAGTVRYVWTFLPPNEIATLPVVALQIYALAHSGAFESLLKGMGLRAPRGFPTDARNWTAETISTFMHELRAFLRHNREAYKDLLEHLNGSSYTSSSNDGRVPSLRALVRTYGGEDRFYLNYYGPSGTITTIPYAAAITDAFNGEDLRGKVVFVGAVGLSTPGTQDQFDTVFTSQLSGVELAATAFANLLADRLIMPLNDAAGAGVVFSLGLLVGLAAYLLRGIHAATAIVIVCGAYFGVATYLFAAHSVWIPVLVPTAFEMPIGLYLILFWRYRHIKVTCATCLNTDIKNSTMLWERMTREKRELELRAAITQYFEMIEHIVKTKKGKVAHSGDDSTMSFWDSPQNDRTRRLDACLAALEITRAVSCFNKEHGDIEFPTRFGLDAGEVTITTKGDGRREDYVLDGDPANTASRIEKLNKKFKTKVLASKAVVADLDCLLLRPIGIIPVKGRSDPLSVFEIICQRSNPDPAKRHLCERFEVALRAYNQKKWSEAIAVFEPLASPPYEDVPSQYYLQLCKTYWADGAPPEHPAIKVDLSDDDYSN